MSWSNKVCGTDSQVSCALQIAWALINPFACSDAPDQPADPFSGTHGGQDTGHGNDASVVHDTGHDTGTADTGGDVELPDTDVDAGYDAGHDTGVDTGTDVGETDGGDAAVDDAGDASVDDTGDAGEADGSVDDGGDAGEADGGTVQGDNYVCSIYAKDSYGIEYAMLMESESRTVPGALRWTGDMRFAANPLTAQALIDERRTQAASTWPKAEQVLPDDVNNPQIVDSATLTGRYEMQFVIGQNLAIIRNYDVAGAVQHMFLGAMTYLQSLNPVTPEAIDPFTENEYYFGIQSQEAQVGYSGFALNVNCLNADCTQFEGETSVGQPSWPSTSPDYLQEIKLRCDKQ